MGRALTLVASLVIAPALVLVAQQPARFRSSTDTVEVHVTVRSADGALVRDLTSDDFEVDDNGRRRDIVVFSGDVQPLTVGVVVDRSGSVDEKSAEVTAVAEAFVGALRREDRASMSTLSWDCEPLTDDKARLAAMLRTPTQADIGSPVWPAVDRTLTALEREAGRRAVLLLSDGENYSRPLRPAIAERFPGPCRYAGSSTNTTLDEVVDRAAGGGVMVYVVTVDIAGVETRDAELRRLARESGGERYRLSREADLPAVFRRIADELHHQYLLGFVPDAFDVKRHDLAVRVKRPGVTVRARRSYVATRLPDPPR